MFVVVLTVIAPLAVNAVNVPAAAVEPPIVMLFIEPSVAGPIVTTPVPVGCNRTLALAGLNVTVLDAVNVVNAPVDAVEAPTVVLLIEPPVIETALAFCVDIVPRPVIAVLGIVVEAVIADVPLPYT